MLSTECFKSKNNSLLLPLEKNVLPYNPLAYIDPAKDKIGYEVPFARLFYKFVSPASSDSIFEDIKALEVEETILMKELFGHA